MSSALAIAAVTAVLKNRLINIMNSAEVTGAVGGTVEVSTQPIDLIDVKDKLINLFMYHVTSNMGWRNASLPSHDSNGNRISNPPLAIDLHYLLTAYNTDNYIAEIMLGYAMQLLHEAPVLAREEIRKVLAPPPPPPPPEFPLALGASNLADQVEQIKISPQSMNIEEMSKLWTAFQAKYRPSAAYHVSVVLIESKSKTKSPLPVLTRGPVDPVTKVERGIVAQPDLVPPYPTIQEAVPPNNQVAIRMGEVLTLRGHHLEGAKAIIFKYAPSQQILTLPVMLGGTYSEIKVQIPDPASTPVPPPNSPQNSDNWQAGLYSITVAIQKLGKPDLISNEIAAALAPKAKITTTVAAAQLDVKLECIPKIRKNQKINLWVGDQEIVPQPLVFDAHDQAAEINFSLTIADWPSSQPQVVRLRIDGIDSICIDRTKPILIFDPSQQVTIS